MQASMLPSLQTAQQSNHLTEKAKTCVLVFFIATFHVPGKYTLRIKFLPAETGIGGYQMTGSVKLTKISARISTDKSAIPIKYRNSAFLFYFLFSNASTLYRQYHDGTAYPAS